MAKKTRSRRAGHAHEQHLVLLRQCAGCGRWVVLLGKADHSAAFHDRPNARAYADRLRREIAGRPDPDPLLVEVAAPDRDVAAIAPPAKSTTPLPAA